MILSLSTIYSDKANMDIYSIYDKKEDRFLETAKLYNEYKRKYETSKYDEELYEIFKETTKQLQKFKV